VTLEMQFKSPMVQMKFGVAGALCRQVTAEHESADQFEHLDWPASQYRFQQRLQPPRFNLRIGVAMTPGLEIRESPSYERICRKKSIVYRFSVNRLE
jgi:hypothetical protein